MGLEAQMLSEAIKDPIAEPKILIEWWNMMSQFFKDTGLQMLSIHQNPDQGNQGCQKTIRPKFETGESRKTGVKILFERHFMII